jgi:predicted GIY-YIG superfamily endonuclease
MNNYCLYWIHYPTQNDPKSEGYIGITSDFNTRMITHSKYAKYKHIYNRIQSGAIPEVLWRNLTKEEAELLEARMRPTENIGWNLAAGGNIPPSRAGKVSPKSLLTGNNRTDRQKEGSIKQAAKLRGRLTSNAIAIELFGKNYNSIQEALRDLQWSKSHYYKYKELVASGMTFESPEELKTYTYKLRNEKISKSHKEKNIKTT